MGTTKDPIAIMLASADTTAGAGLVGDIDNILAVDFAVTRFQGTDHDGLTDASGSGVELSDAALTEQIGQLETIVEQLEGYLTRLANTVLARNFVMSEVGTT